MEKNTEPKKSEMERLIIGDKKFLHIMPEQMRIITDRMILAVKGVFKEKSQE